MAHWQKLLLGTSLVFFVSAPLYANPAQAPAPTEPMSEPAVVSEKTPPAAGQCADAGGVPEEPHAKASFFYPFPVAPVAPDDKALRATTDGGIMLVNGVQYTLQYIELPKQAALPFSSVQYPMEARFVHRAADGSTAILSVPVAEGDANIAVEKMLQKKSMRIDPNDLLPDSRDIALMGRTKQGGCNGPVERHYVMTKPVYVSATQIRKFEELF